MNFLINIYEKYLFLSNKNNLMFGDWGLGIGNWGLGIGPNPQSPIPNPPYEIKNNNL